MMVLVWGLWVPGVRGQGQDGGDGASDENAAVVVAWTVRAAQAQGTLLHFCCPWHHHQKRSFEPCGFRLACVRALALVSST